MIKIIIADDHEIVRKGLRLTILAEQDMELVGEAENGKKALLLVEEKKPDVVLLDIKMPDMDGIQAAREIHIRYPQITILMVSSFSSDAQIYEALQAGASGYLLKDVSGDELLSAIRKAHQGEPQLHPKITKRLIEQVQVPADPFSELTPREKDILKLIASGLSNKEICLHLNLSSATVKGYVSSLLEKLQVSDRTQAALLAVRHGFIDLNDLPDFNEQV